ncbi:MAG: RNA polymerase sigma factor [Lewinella sp.]
MVNRKVTKLEQPLRIVAQPGRNFGLSKHDFLELTQTLRDGNEKLFELIFLRHFEQCIEYLKVNDDAQEVEAYDIVMETAVRFRELLLKGKIQYGNLRYLFTSMARQELRRTRIRNRKIYPMQIVNPRAPSESNVFDEEAYQILAKAIRQLGQECKHLLRMYYFLGQSLKDIAEDQDRTAASVRQQKRRCILQLRNVFFCFFK